MANPFGSLEHYAVTTTMCLCGDAFVSVFLLDVHLYGREEAVTRFQARLAALDAIEARAILMAAEGGGS